MSTVVTTDEGTTSEISAKEQLLNEFPQIDIVLAEYKPWPRNYNQHPESQIEALAASLTTFGQPKNIVVWNGFIVDGHGLVEAAQSLGWDTLRANQIPTHWEESKVEAFLVAANELAKMADPDKAKLSELLADMNQNGIDLKAVGWNHERLDELLAEVRANVEPEPGEAVDAEVDMDKKQRWLYVSTSLGALTTDTILIFTVPSSFKPSITRLNGIAVASPLPIIILTVLPRMYSSAISFALMGCEAAFLLPESFTIST